MNPFYPFGKGVRVVAELSLDENGEESRKKGSLRLDVVVFIGVKTWVAFDMKLGKAGKGNPISVEKWNQYERRFGALLFTFQFKI
ncbi:hypothetical protein ACO0LD_16920 [Undibacterium sp. Ji83W]|uniref:hypothetical protein n=1 Tax=Undibacterium sp. Ji83W TaxID=3413043 RepID=UPI003BEF83F1